MLRLAKRMALVTAFVCASAHGQETCSPEANVCLPKGDFQRFLDIALERQCLEHTKPSFELDRIEIVTDSDGRVFHSGADPKRPFVLQMKWCHYDVEGRGEVDIVAGMRVPERSGIRFRPKAYLGYLPLKLEKVDADEGIDAGVLIDWLYFDWINLNLAAGLRSVGAGLGFDITRNFGAYAGYGLGWTAPLHNINFAFYFAF